MRIGTILETRSQLVDLVYSVGNSRSVAGCSGAGSYGADMVGKHASPPA